MDTETNEIYHAFNKSIAGYKIFNNEADFVRMKQILKYYQLKDRPSKFSHFMKNSEVQQHGFEDCFATISTNKEKSFQIIAYCLMPTHLHLILRQKADSEIFIFMSNILNSYARYFNIKHNRKGPLWEGRFKKVLIKTDEQLLHLTMYIHLNPVVAYLVGSPKEWLESSYKEYVSLNSESSKICKFDDLLNIRAETYEQFVEERI